MPENLVGKFRACMDTLTVCQGNIYNISFFLIILGVLSAGLIAATRIWRHATQSGSKETTFSLKDYPLYFVPSGVLIALGITISVGIWVLVEVQSNPGGFVASLDRLLFGSGTRTQ